jgi:predicted dehydrogenase
MSKKTQKQVRLGIIGVGSMGSCHAKTIKDGKVKRCKLSAVCDIDPKALAKYDDSVAKFESASALIKSGEVDAVLIATPHYFHVPLAVKCLKGGLHVLLEKPMSVQKSECLKLIKDSKKHKKQIFALMFNQRTDPAYKHLKKMIDAGQLGKLVRMNWIITNWFRTDAYYKSGGWRATWSGEGGGVLVNQCPHQLDLLQWLCGMPTKVVSHCSIGKSHKIEVEDEVTSYLEFKGGATGVFVTSTGEAPGTNRLELAGDKAKVVVEGNVLKIWKNKMSASKYSRTTDQKMGGPKTTYKEVKFKNSGPQHAGIMRSFTNAILDGTPLVAKGEEGIGNVELANAMLLSGMTGKAVDLPMATAAYNKLLKELVKKSTKKSVKKKAKSKRKKR